MRALADDEFHARFSATARHYLYPHPQPPQPAGAGRGPCLACRSPAGRRGDACTRRRSLVGKHDFTTFRAAECQAQSPVKTLDRLDVRQRGEEIHIEASARSFLHHQIRSFAGTLKLVGEGKWTPRDVADALAARDRSRCGPVAPPDGLYLVRVDY